MNSIGDVLALTPGPSWHECVAVIQEIAAHLQPGQPLPAPEDLLLEADGTITFGFAGESVRPQVADLATLLGTLLNKTEAPQGLRDIASENARDEPAHSTIASFSRALAFYERPNRQSDLQALAGRLDVRSHTTNVDRTIAEIRERVVRKSEQTGEKQKDAGQPAAPGSAERARAIARARALAVAAAVVLAVAGLSAFTLLRGSNGNKPVVAGEKTPAAPVADSAKATTGTDTESASPEGAATEHHPVGTTATSREPISKKATSRTSPRAAAPTRVVGASTFRAAAAGIAPVRPLPSNSAAPGSPAGPGARVGTAVPKSPPDAPEIDDATYSSADPEVTPPVWNRRQLPSQPAPDSRTGYFDIVIDTNGDVESVRLISPTRRYEERMLMAAAKAWKFRPARLNGQPVKYRMRVPITLTWTVDQ